MNIMPEKLLKESSPYKLKLPETLIIKHEIYVLDVKLISSDIPSIYKTDGIYPGYPRSAGNWVSVILEDLISDDFIMRLVDKSYHVTTI